MLKTMLRNLVIKYLTLKVTKLMNKLTKAKDKLEKNLGE